MSRFDSGSTPKLRPQRTANLGDFIHTPGSGDGLGRALFCDVSLANVKRSHGKMKTSSNWQPDRSSMPTSAVNKFDLESKADFPDVAHKNIRFAIWFPSWFGFSDSLILRLSRIVKSCALKFYQVVICCFFTWTG
jgi:hypothetical protein